MRRDHTMSRNGRQAMLPPWSLAIALGVGVHITGQCYSRVHHSHWRTVRVCPGCFVRRHLQQAAERLPAVRVRAASESTLARQHRMASQASYPRPALSRCSRRLGPVSRLLMFVSCFSTLSVLGVGNAPSRLPSTHDKPIAAYGQLNVRLSHARKRAYKRAQIRATHEGTTTYKGRVHNLQTLSLQYVGRRPPRQPKPLPVPTHALRVVPWNCGGLHAGRYTELMAWLEQDRSDPIHIACIQESHWPQYSEYSTDRWTVIGTGTGSSAAGVLFIINKSAVASDSVKYTELIPGRALQVRMQTDPPLDLLGVYQYAWNPRKKSLRHMSDATCSASELLQSRATVWQAIGRWAAAVPKRNALALLGDFNTAAKTALPHVGPGIAEHKLTQYPDQDRFHQVLQTHGLVLLNTWGRRDHHAWTYPAGSQIDFIATRLPCAQFSRRASALRDAPVVHPTGMRHVPLSCRPPFPAKPPQHSRPTLLGTSGVRKTLDEDPDAARRFRAGVVALLPQPHLQEDASNAGLPNLERALDTPWHRAAGDSSTGARPRGHPRSEHISLKEFWESKLALRASIDQVNQYHAPLLWHVSSQQLNAVLRPGKLIFPPEWHQSFLVLLAKPGKRPSSPANLRPISLLPIQSKLLARVIAVRLQPYVMRALHNTPQFAYLAGRQSGDAVDRVISHSYRIRERLKQYSRSHARTSVKTPTLVGGMQLSLDLKKAYDRLPRHLLERSLTRIGTPHDLVELILFIHDNASLVISRQEEQTEVGLGRGVRQGCGLSPLLWTTYTLLLFDTFDHYLPRDAQTGYADDFIFNGSSIVHRSSGTQ